MYVQSDVPFWRVLMRIAVLLSLAFLGCASLLTATAAPPTLSSPTIEDASTVKPGAMPPMMPDLKTWKIKGKGGFTSTAAGTRVQVTVAVQRRHPVSNSNPPDELLRNGQPFRKQQRRPAISSFLKMLTTAVTCVMIRMRYGIFTKINPYRR